MLPTDVTDQLPQWLLLGVLALFVLSFVGSRLAEAYEGFAKILGPLGALYRRRAAAEAESRKLAIRVEARAIALEIKPPDYDRLKQDLKRVIDRVVEMEATEEINQAYLVHDARWHFDVDEYLAAHGHNIPSRVPYRDFARKFREGQRLGDDGVWRRVEG